MMSGNEGALFAASAQHVLASQLLCSALFGTGSYIVSCFQNVQFTARSPLHHACRQHACCLAR